MVQVQGFHVTGADGFVDIKSKEARSANMAKICSKNTRPETFIRSALHKSGFRFYVNSNLVEGRPDLYFPKRRIAVFVHGCYWHRHAGCKFSYYPKSNAEFWNAKFVTNKKRDALVAETLLHTGVRVLIIWECVVKKMMKDNILCQEHLKQISDFILSSNIELCEISHLTSCRQAIDGCISVI